MGQVNKVVASPSGQVFKNKAKNLRPRKKEKFNKKEQPSSRSQDYQDAGVYKGSRVMKAGDNGDRTHFRGGDYKATSDNLNPKYDGRAHPSWRE